MVGEGSEKERVINLKFSALDLVQRTISSTNSPQRRFLTSFPLSDACLVFLKKTEYSRP